MKEKTKDNILSSSPTKISSSPTSSSPPKLLSSSPTKLSSSPTKENDDGGFKVIAHRRTNSFSSLAKAYRSSNKNDNNTNNNKYNRTTTSNRLNNSSLNESDDTQQLIAVLEHQVSEGDKARREMALEIAKLKDQLQRAEAQIALLKQANSSLHGQLLSKEKYRNLPKPIDVELCLEGENESMDSPGSDSQWSDPLNTTMYPDSMHDSISSEPDSDFTLNTIINNINMNTYNNINNIQVNSIKEINYVIGINNINNITNFASTNNYHTTNNVNTNTNVTVNNISSDSVLSTPSGSSNSSDASISPCKSKDEMNVSFADKDRRARLFSRTNTQHKRRGSDTESSPKLDEKYQRRHSEGKVLRIAGLREQGVELSSSVLPPPPRHLVHAGFVREGDHVLEGYWIDDVLLLLFKDFLLVACQPKNDFKSKYQFKEVVNLTATTRVHTWETDAEHYGIGINTDQCERSFLISSKEECDKWIAVINKHVASLTAYQGPLRHYLIAPCEGFVVEPTAVVAVGDTKLCLEEPRKGIYHYQSFFYSKPHINYVGGSNACPVAISIEDKTIKLPLSPSMFLRRNSDAMAPDTEPISHRVLVRTQAGDECVCIAIPAGLVRSFQTAHTEILTQLSQALPDIALPSLKMNTTLFRVKSVDLDSDLLQYEANNMRRCHKIAVVYCAKGARTESEMLHTTHANASAAFLQFLTLLGQEVALKSWADYSGGLDIKNDTDGTHSIFTNFWGIPVMFHVSTMLPNDHHNPNKRHIGNDIVVIIFKDHDDDSLFNPSTFKSHLNHIFCVVQQVDNPNGPPSYRVSFCAKEGIGMFQPALPSPPIFVKDAKFKHFLLAKVVNAERAAMRSAPFAKRHTVARFTFLKNLWRQTRIYNIQPKEIDETYGQIHTM